MPLPVSFCVISVYFRKEHNITLDRRVEKKYNNEAGHPGVAQLVARMVRVHEAVGSNPATRTKNLPFSYENGGFFLLFVAKIERPKFAFSSDHRNTTDGFWFDHRRGVPF